MRAQPGRYDTVPLDGVTGALQEPGRDFLSDSEGEKRIKKKKTSNKTGSTGSLDEAIDCMGNNTEHGCIRVWIPAHSDGLQQRDEGAVRLPAHLRQLHVHLDALPPAPRLRNSEHTVNVQSESIAS